MSGIGERLAQEVERLGGVTWASGRLGSARNTVYNWCEKGNIPANKMEALRQEGADVAYILTGTHTIQDGRAAYTAHREPEPVTALWDRLTPAQQTALRGIMRDLAGDD